MSPVKHPTDSVLTLTPVHWVREQGSRRQEQSFLEEVVPELGPGALRNVLEVEIGSKHPSTKVQPSRDPEGRRTCKSLRP